MFGSLFSGIDKIGRGLDASWTKNEIISSNIANIDTPGYKRKKAEFGDLLNAKLSSSSSLNLTNGRHIEGRNNQVNGVTVTTDASTFSMRTDENNVNIDTEMSELSKNSIYYNVLTQRATGEISKLQSVIRDS